MKKTTTRSPFFVFNLIRRASKNARRHLLLKGEGCYKRSGLSSIPHSSTSLSLVATFMHTGM